MAEREQFFDVTGNQQHGASARSVIAQPAAQLGGGIQIEAAANIVSDNGGGGGCQRSRGDEALAIAARKRPRRSLRPSAAHAESVDELPAKLNGSRPPNPSAPRLGL